MRDGLNEQPTRGDIAFYFLVTWGLISGHAALVLSNVGPMEEVLFAGGSGVLSLIAAVVVLYVENNRRGR